MTDIKARAVGEMARDIFMLNHPPCPPGYLSAYDWFRSYAAQYPGAYRQAVYEATAALTALHRLATAEGARLAGAGDVVERAVANILQTILDMDDRTSPEDWPEALLVTGEELTNIATEKLADVSALITDLRATIARLVAENSALAANQCGHGYGTETGDHRCRLQDQIVALTAERDAARETALREAEEECREFAHEIFNCFSPEPHEAVETAASRILTLIPTTEGGRDAG